MNKLEKMLSLFCLTLMGLAVGLSLFAIPMASAESEASWPREVTHIGLDASLNNVWGSATSSDINWTFDTQGDNPFTNVIVVDGIAYFGTMMNYIYALDAVTGKQLWRFMADNWIMTNPVVAEGKLFAGSGNRYFQAKPGRGGTRGTGSNSLYALDAKTGELVWRYPVPGEAMPTPLYKDGVVYYVTGDRTLYAMKASDGTLLYKYPLGSVFSMSSINIADDILVFGGGFPFKVYGFNLKTRTIAWETPFENVYSGLDDSNPAISNGLLYINGVADNDSQSSEKPPRHQFYALETRTGQLRWSYDTGPGYLVDDNKSTTPVIVDGIYYGGSSLARKFYALDAASGQEKWVFNVGIPIKGAPVVIDRYVIFGDTKGNVYTLARDNGRLINKLALGGGIAPQGPSIFNGTIYIENQNGKVYALPVARLFIRELMAPLPATAGAAEDWYFKETGHSVGGNFLKYWQDNGGLAQFGFPLTQEFREFRASEKVTYTVQYFERARFELHEGGRVLLGLLGQELTKSRTVESPFQATLPSPGSGSRYFEETRHMVLTEFYGYWQTHGGLAINGFPISEAFQEIQPDGSTLTVQYFERARFELHNDHLVLLGLLGKQSLT